MCGSNRNLECRFLWMEENQRTQRKTLGAWDENQQQSQPTCDAGSGNQTRATVVGGERSHHCAIPAPNFSQMFPA